MGIPLLFGRGPRATDTADAPKVAVINEMAARRYFGNGSPLGRRFRFSSKPEWEYEVIGIARDAKYSRLRREIAPTVYVPYLQKPFTWPIGGMYFEVRTSSDPSAMFAAIRKAVAEIDRNVPLSDMKTQVVAIDESLGREHLFARLCSFLGLLALVLACVGLYGLLAYNVTRRTREIGLRMALGARRSGILWLVLREAVALAGVGVLLGVPLVLASGKLVASFLFGVQPRDPATIAGAALLMLCVAVFAGCLPARRAIQIEPMAALRCE
jgi:predicted permease